MSVIDRMREVFGLLGQTKFKVIEVTDLPAQLDKQKIYIVGEGPYRWFLALLCPCGCQEVIYLNVRPDSHPYWRIREHAGTISIDPSIWRQKGCGSHFYIRKGRIQWCKEAIHY